MNTWKRVLREGLIAGSLASVMSALLLVIAGRRENGHGAAPVNAISHWVWDRPALRENAPSLRHTLVGYLVHHGASVFWGVLHAAAWSSGDHVKRPLPALSEAAATSAIACFVDYRMTPERLKPGFEHRLSRRSMTLVYAGFALGLAIGQRWAGRNSR